jgi:hypothetical protein
MTELLPRSQINVYVQVRVMSHIIGYHRISHDIIRTSYGMTAAKVTDQCLCPGEPCPASMKGSRRQPIVVDAMCVWVMQWLQGYGYASTASGMHQASPHCLCIP